MKFDKKTQFINSKYENIQKTQNNPTKICNVHNKRGWQPPKMTRKGRFAGYPGRSWKRALLIRLFFYTMIVRKMKFESGACNMGRKQKRIKVCSILMALCLAGMTAACGLAGGGEPGGEKETDKGQEEAVIHVLVTTHAWTKDIEDIPSFQELSEKTGVKVVWEQVRSGWEEKKNAILSSGDVPDVFLGGAITDADISAYPELFLPLNDYVEEQAPNVMRMFEEKPDTRMLAVFTDGNIYGLPSVKFHRPDSTSMMMINQDWLDALGLETPRTLEEFRDVLRAFRDGDPNGNGKADEIPFDFSNNRGLFTAMNLIGAYGKCAEDFSGEWFGMAQGEILFLPVTEEYYQLTGYLHSLFEEGLINPEVFSQDYSQFQQKSKNPAAMTVGGHIGMVHRGSGWPGLCGQLSGASAAPGFRRNGTLLALPSGAV